MAVLAAALFVSYAYYFQGGGNNQNSRVDLTRAIAERGTLAIDAYHENCADKAFVDGHYYSNKSPGQPVLAVPAFVVGRPLLRAGGIDPESLWGITILTYLGTLLTCALPTALAAIALAWLARQLGSSEGGAIFSAVVFGLGTPIWAYATLFWGHALAASCLVFALCAAPQPRRSSWGSRLARQRGGGRRASTPPPRRRRSSSPSRSPSFGGKTLRGGREPSPVSLSVGASRSPSSSATSSPRSALRS
jgi:hypothetical protein